MPWSRAIISSRGMRPWKLMRPAPRKCS